VKLNPIIPKSMAKKFKSAPDAVDKGMDDAADAVKQDFEKTVKGWEHPVTFAITTQGADRVITTDDEIWGYVDAGTRPHVIVAKRARVLRFATGGSPKTAPGRITSGGGSKGGAVVFRPRVNHPGTKARLFSQQIAKLWRRGTAPFIRQALEEHFR
jgi:hypothetical protein